MDKDLENKDKNKAAEPQANAPANSAAMDFADASIGAYTDLSKKAWDEEHKAHAWKDSLKGRLAIRMGSRGVLGAVFFTTGTLLANKWLRYNYDPAKGFTQQKNPLQFMAKLIDTVVGTPIQYTVEKITSDEVKGLQAVRFRPTAFSYESAAGRTKSGHFVTGRSLGHEASAITFDFFCASVGDAWGRDIAGFFDPNIKKDWRDEQGNINFPKAVKTVLSSVFRYVTYNGGEDWAVAIPYAYYMKGQRALINHFSPGFMYDFDRGLHGGSYKVGDDHKIIGNYALAGAIDLQGRFTVYNVGTLLYREAYNYWKNKLLGKQVRLYGSPEDTEKRGVLGTVADLAKWVVRGTIKGVIYMTPAVPAFWITRVTQKKGEGRFIHKDKGMLGYYDSKRGSYQSLRAMDWKEQELDIQKENEHDRNTHRLRDENLYYANYQPNTAKASMYDQFAYQGEGTLSNPSARPDFKTYGMGQTFPERLFDKIGFANAGLAEWFDYPAKFADKTFGRTGRRLKRQLGIDSFANFTHPFINASVSYTPYMIAKAEAAKLWEHGKMDMATERLIEGATNLNWGEFKAGAGEMWNSFLHRPMPDPAREAEGLKRMELDQSPADVFVDTKSQIQQEKNLIDQRQRFAGWQQRIISGRPEKKAEEKKDAKPRSFAEQEAMRKALDDLNPPTNSIH